MNNYRPSPQFEKLLRQAVSVPNPDPEFVEDLQTRLSQEDPKMTPKTRRLTPRLAWALAAALILFVIVMLANSPNVVKAMKRIFGYIPGVGMVEENVSYRILDEPVSVEREGITLTIEKALLSPEQTELVYRFDTIPAPRLTCEGRDSMARLRLPDGTILLPMSGGGSEGADSVLTLDYTFGPAPVDVDQMTLVIPCRLESGEVWEIPLMFIPLPPDLTPEPLMVLSPVPPTVTEPSSPLPSKEPTTTPSDDENLPAPMPLTIEGVIEQEDGIILLCKTHPVAGAEGSAMAPFPMQIHFTDANGDEIPFEFVNSSELLGIDEHIYPWAFKLLTTDLEWPLTTTLDWIGVSIEETQATFDLETGDNPQVGQEWEINQDLQVGDHDILVLSVHRMAEGYNVFFQADSEVESIQIAIQHDDQQNPPAGLIGGGGGGGGGQLSTGVMYDGPIPDGKLTFVIKTLHVRIPGPWSMRWSPDDLSSDESGD